MARVVFVTNCVIIWLLFVMILNFGGMNIFAVLVSAFQPFSRTYLQVHELILLQVQIVKPDIIHHQITDIESKQKNLKLEVQQNCL